MQKDILSIQELADYTGLSVAYIYRLTHLRKIPHYKPLGKKLFFKIDEVREFLTSKRVKPLAEIEQEATDLLTTKNRKQ